MKWWIVYFLSTRLICRISKTNTHTHSQIGYKLEVVKGRLKMRDMKMRDQIAGVETAGKVSMESQSVKKCLKVVVFVCRVIPAV